MGTLGLLFFSLNSFSQQDFLYKGDLNTIFEDADENDFSFIVEIMAEWCGYCKKFEKGTMKDSRVLDYLNDEGIRFLKIDGEKGEGINFSKKYKVTGFPTILFFASDGKMVKRINGYQSPGGFMVSLKEFSSSVSYDSEILNYFDAKQRYFDEAYTIEKIWPEKYCLQAYSFAKKEDPRGMKELSLELDDSELQMASLVYFIYSGSNEKVAKMGWSCFQQKLLNETQEHFLSFYLIKNSPDFYLCHQLINQSIRTSSSPEKLDTRAAIEFLSGNPGDAKSTMKKMKKASKNPEDLPRSFDELSLMINSN